MTHLGPGWRYEMEQIILCTIVSCYAVYVDLTAAVLRGSGDIYQTLPMTVWGVIVSIAAIIDAMVVFRKQIRAEVRRNKKH